MGLNLVVGHLSDLKESDPESFALEAEVLRNLSQFLKREGLGHHSEPETAEYWSAEMIGYSGLHDVRRLAAYVDCDRPLPKPSTGPGSTEDPILIACHADLEEPDRPNIETLLGRGPSFRRQFNHLMLHGDAEGYYLPIDFAEVLVPPLEMEVPGSYVGSSVRLAHEVARLCRVLEIPDELDEESPATLELLDRRPGAGKLWQQYPRETYGCVLLRAGCAFSMRSGAALVFC